MKTRISLLATVAAIVAFGSADAAALNAMPILTAQPGFSDKELTEACKQSDARDVLCQGNEGRIRLQSATIETVGDTLKAQVTLRQRNRHVPGKLFGEPIIAYDSSSNISIDLTIDNHCNIVSKHISSKSEYVKAARVFAAVFDKRLEDVVLKDKTVPGCKAKP